ncbi:multiple sugar transport system permease protein [Bradyrhizobium liaoningense]
MAITLSGDQAIPGPPLSSRLTPAQVWGIVLLAPYLLVFLAFVVYPVCYGLWLARAPSNYVALYNDPIFARAAVNTLIFLVIGINIKMLIALFLSGFFAQQRTWIKWLSVIFILPWAVPSIPTILSVRFMLNPEWGMINHYIFALTGDDGPNWLNDPTVALTMAIAVHIWKSLPFWTLILITGRLAISHDLFEAAEVDGASWWQKFRYITWPSMQTLYVTCTLLSMIWTLGDSTASTCSPAAARPTSRTCWRRSASAISGSTSSRWPWHRSSARCRSSCRSCTS